MPMKRRLLPSLMLLIVVVFSAVGVVLYHAPANVRKTTDEVTLPFSRGSSFTLLRTVAITIGNETNIVGESEEVFMVVEPGFPLTKVRMLNGAEKTIPTIFLAVPRELLTYEFYAPIETALVNESLCIQLSPKGSKHAGGTPGTCKSVFVEIKYNATTGLTQQTIIYTGIGGAIYYERVYVVARSVSGEQRARFDLVCLTLYSTNIMFATPGLYYLDERGGRYVVDREYSRYRPLLLVLKTPENQKVWESLLGRYRGYVLLVSPLLADLNRVPELDRLLEEMVLYLE